MAQSKPYNVASSVRHEIRLTRPIDLDHLARQTASDPHLEREALQLFVVQSQIQLLKLKRSLGVRERLDTAHTLKGSAAAVGAWGVAECSEQIQELADGGSERGFNAVLSELEAEIEAVRSFVGVLSTEH